MASYLMVLKVEAVGGNMLSIYEPHEENPIKCQLLEPIYNDKGTAIDWQPSIKFCWCNESGFERTQTREQNRRYTQVKGVLTTNSLKKDEINIDWKINFDGDIFIIDRINQRDDKKQQVHTTNPIVITTLYVRR